jgi:hypothetical protein
MKQFCEAAGTSFVPNNQTMKTKERLEMANSRIKPFYILLAIYCLVVVAGLIYRFLR